MIFDFYGIVFFGYYFLVIFFFFVGVFDFGVVCVWIINVSWWWKFCEGF